MPVKGGLPKVFLSNVIENVRMIGIGKKGGATMKILVCDDEHLVRVIVSTILESAGHQVETACDGQEALENIRAHPNSYDLLIADNIMPRLNGVELVENVRASNIQVKVVMITGFPNQVNAGTRDRLRLNGFLNKPFKPDELLDCVNQLGP
jgi:two-component system cell cycle sensor histidine kinase/response regulator CckA